MKAVAFVVILVLSVSVLGACGQGEVKERVEDTVMRTSNEQKEKSEKEQRAEKVAKDFKEVKGAIAYDTEDELVVAFHVTQYQKFFTEKIEKKVKKALEKEFPEENVVVSHDLKIRLEIERLRRDVEQNQISEKELEKRIEKMKTLREEKA
ncbi:YhcN/YlaJ family sporulation lipoprotein [Sutcliffiella horikoshii]|uniref:YhcN/YlaJ family sporulation lipoprotein n=1 Tax=Sutcliffiella horikoshii TaxID=79883 RepID=UPI003CE7D968